MYAFTAVLIYYSDIKRFNIHYVVGEKLNVNANKFRLSNPPIHTKHIRLVST